MGKTPRCTGFRTTLVIFGLVGMASGQTQPPYSYGAGKTTLFNVYNPLQPAPKAPDTPSPAYGLPMAPTIPMDQYLAKKAAAAQNSQSSFPFPPGVQVSSPVVPKAPTTTQAPIAGSPTSSWEGIKIAPTSQQQPPSPDIAVGPSDAVMVINSTIAQFSKTGTLKVQTDFVDWFAGLIPTICPNGTASNRCQIFDPSIRYDQLHGRFLFLATSRTLPDLRVSYLLLSVSNGATYDSGWKTWVLDATLDGTTQTANWGDFWRFGFDNAAVYLSGNMYNSAATFQYAKIRVLKKSELYNPATTTLNYQDLFNLKNEDGSPADSLAAVHQRGMPSAVNARMLVNSTTFTVPASFLTVWQIDDPLVTPITATRSTIKGLWAYDYPAPAPQAGLPAKLDSSDSRMLKAIYRNGYLYTARDTGYPDQATTVTFDVINTATMQLTSQARLVNTNSFYPAFDIPASTAPGTPFATANVITGTTTSAIDGTLTYAGISKLKGGEGAFDVGGSSPDRWGDYFGGAVDPVSGGLWTSGQYAKTPVSGFGVWGTWVGFFPWLTTSSFTDAPSTSPYSDYINVLSSWSVTAGCGPATFCPTQLVSRAQIATFLMRAMFGANFTYTTTPYFTDVPNTSIYFPYIQKLRDLGITAGCTATTFCPDNPVTRAEAAVFTVRGKFAGLFGSNFPYPLTAFFTDVPSTAGTFPFVQKMYELGITSGCTATQFCPDSLLTRQEVAVFLTRGFLN